MHQLTYACVLTRDIVRLGRFYGEVLQQAPESRGAYMEFRTEPGIFSLWSVDEFQGIVGGDVAARLAQGSVMLEFRVEDVEAEYARLREIEQPPVDIVLPPTTLPWGNRSVYFRDPDGNLVNFFTPPRS
jgi:catechol 2,3-dioxygenase-like lactoylglutathione lyase family enzyme